MIHFLFHAIGLCPDSMLHVDLMDTLPYYAHTLHVCSSFLFQISNYIKSLKALI